MCVVAFAMKIGMGVSEKLCVGGQQKNKIWAEGNSEKNNKTF